MKSNHKLSKSCESIIKSNPPNSYGGGIWLYLADYLSQTHTLNHKNPLHYLDCHENPADSLAMTILRKITRHCEIFARKSKQSINQTRIATISIIASVNRRFARSNPKNHLIPTPHLKARK